MTGRQIQVLPMRWTQWSLLKERGRQESGQKPTKTKKQDNIFSWIGTLCFGNPVKSLALLSVFILALAGRQTCFSEEPKCGLAVLRCKYTWEHMHQFHKKLKWSHLLHPASNYSDQHFSVQGDDLISWHSIKKMHMMRWLDVEQIWIIVLSVGDFKSPISSLDLSQIFFLEQSSTIIHPKQVYKSDALLDFSQFWDVDRTETHDTVWWKHWQSRFA